MITERTIINALIIGASLILVPFLISTTLSFDYGPAFIIGGLLLMIIAFFFIKDNLTVWVMLGGYMSGTLNFLPLPLQATHIFGLVLILYYLTGYVIIRQKRIKLGKTKFLWPILIITLIILYHNHSLSGIRMLSGTSGGTEGAKPAILLYVVVLTYFCGINIGPPSVQFLSKVPFYCVILNGIFSIPYMLTTFVPSLAPYLYMFTDSVNVEAYVNSAGGASDGGTLSRLGILGGFGGTLQLYLLCYYPIGTWWRPERWWVAALWLMCLTFAALSGYRNVLFGFLLTTVFGAFCYYGTRALFFVGGLGVAGVLFGIMATSGLINLPVEKLPFIAQRSLSFLPGNWDPEALESSKISNAFRQGIQTVYVNEYMKKSPLLGNGFDIDKEKYEFLRKEMYSDPSGYTESKAYIEGKQFHAGWISLYDCVGIIGSVAFLALGWFIVMTTGRFIFGSAENRRSSLFPLHAWMFVTVVTTLISFFYIFGDFAPTFCAFCVYAMILSQIADIKSATSTTSTLPERRSEVDFSRIGSGNYGYPSKGYPSK
jgi:hypothetical protein